ncbi:uncharacterized protein LOC134276842 [Saccostrea cucullata]|uniref:uncharacterized protein LOC134276842 n=1 Tax=Saccostrea cuccullata TaxID=36930 RepID=UPI002ED48EBD
MSLTPEEHCYSFITKELSLDVRSTPPLTKQSFEDGYPHLVTMIIHEPQIFHTGIEGGHMMMNVACMDNANIWTCADGRITLYNVDQNQSQLISIKQIRTWPNSIAVTKGGDLVFTTHSDRTVNILNNEGIREVIRLRMWRPHSVCCTSSGDFLVTLENDDKKRSKIIRYSGYKEKQSIQFNENGKSLYSSSGSNLHICENRTINRISVWLIVELKQ